MNGRGKALRSVVSNELLAQVGGLGHRARQLAEGLVNGQHRSPHRGASVEFAQHREYSPGDEMRHLDWKAYARSDKYLVKQFEDETNLRCFLLVDASGSMSYGQPSKLDYAATLAAAMAYALIKQGDAVGLLTFGSSLGTYVPPRARPDHFWNLVSVLEREPVGGTTNLRRPLEHLAEVAGRRALILIFSDAFDEDEQFISLARQLRKRRHDVVFHHVLHPDELGFPFRDLTLFEDLETSDRELADPRGMREAYLKEMQGFCDGLRSRLQEGDVGYHLLPSDLPAERAMRQMLSGTGS